MMTTPRLAYAALLILATLAPAGGWAISLREAPDSTAGTNLEALPSGNVEHGRYLVERVAMCAECHSDRDESGEIIEERRFLGGPIPMRPPWPNDWATRAPRNRGLPGYTVEEGIRLLTEGAIAADGRQLKPPMPRFRMTRQDAADVVAYMKSLK